MSTVEAAGPGRDPPGSCHAAPGPSALRETLVRAVSVHSPGLAQAADAWSDDAVAQLHEGVLRHALQSLHARGNADLKKEILRWIFCPPAMVLTRHDPHGHPRETVLRQECTPFSFEQCCRICGYSPQRLRDGLASLLHAIGLADTLAEITRPTRDATDPPSTGTHTQEGAHAAPLGAPQAPAAGPGT